MLSSGVLTTPDNHQIHYDHYCYGHEAICVIAHGFLNSKESLLLKELGQILSDTYDILMFDFRGHGKSTGIFTWMSKEYLDLEVVLQYIRKDYKKVGVIGFSLGAATSMITISKAGLVDSLVAVAAPTQLWKIDYHFWQLNFDTDIKYNLYGDGKIGKGVRSGPFWLKKEKPISIVGNIRIPIFYVHGDKDWIIKPWHSKVLYEKTNTKKRLSIIKNGLHAEYLIRNNKEETVGLMRKWFKETL